MKQVLVLSGKGGTGKTSISAALIELSKAKVMADCDVDAPNLHLIAPGDDRRRYDKNFVGGKKAVINPEKCVGCGLCDSHCAYGAIDHDDHHYTVRNYRCEGCGVCEVVCPHEAIDMKDAVAGNLSLYFGTSVFSTAKLIMGEGTSGKLVAEVKQPLYHVNKGKYAIIDGSPGIGCPVISSISGVDVVLAVVEPTMSGIADMKRIVATTQSFGIKVVVVINKVIMEKPVEEQALIGQINQFCEEESIKILGYIPYLKEVPILLNQGKNLLHGSDQLKTAIHTMYEAFEKEMQL